VSPALTPIDLITRVNREVERSLLRARNGMRYVTTPPTVGATPKDVVWKRDKAELWRYRSEVPVRYDPPLVIVHSLVSRSYIFDLRPGSSTVEFLLGQGLDVFLLDFGIPDELDADNTLETYVDEYLPRAIDAVLAESGSEEVTIAGYCLGGVLASLYAAAYDDAPVRNLMLWAAPFDFSEMGVMVAAVRDGRLNADELIDHTGNVPADALYSGFFMQAPTKQVAQYATLLEHLWNDQFVDGYQAMAQWSREQVPFPGAAFRELIRDLSRGNALYHGEVVLARRTRRLRDISAPFLNLYGAHDHVSPPESVAPLTDLVGSEDREGFQLRAGHVGLLVGGTARKATLPTLHDWLQPRLAQAAPSPRLAVKPLAVAGEEVAP
jgi:polyhydroxyalkanoate synthase